MYDSRVVAADEWSRSDVAFPPAAAACDATDRRMQWNKCFRSLGNPSRLRHERHRLATVSAEQSRGNNIGPV
jgi:hypothetical protein